MRLFRTPPYQNVPELLDSIEGVSERDLHGTLRDIRRANIFGLGTWVVRHHLHRLLYDVPHDRSLHLLDVATGSGDIPEEISRWASGQGRSVRFTLTDISEPILRVASARIKGAGFGEVASYTACDATQMPFPDKTFDVALCSLAIHHLDVGQAERLIGEMERVSRLGFIINDVYRSHGAWLMARLLTQLTTRNHLTRHDGPASVLRAFTPNEVRRLSERAGVPLRVYTHPFWRMAAVREKGQS